MTAHIEPTNAIIQDRNFDEVAEHFAQKVYGGLKGEIRLAVLRRDILDTINNYSKELGRPLNILDVGAGLAQISLQLAVFGHEVTINDISANMLAKAKDSFPDHHSYKIHWLHCPYQELEDKLVDTTLNEKYDVILCHALLEWLAEPKQFIEFAQRYLNSGGKLSLCFYNPASFTYRNLIMGNFNLLNNTNYKADNKKSLTPNNPVAKEDVFAWLEATNFKIEKVSGMRVFHDYSPLKRGGHNHPEEVLAMEVRYSDQEPFKWMGRYLHVLAEFNATHS